MDYLDSKLDYTIRSRKIVDSIADKPDFWDRNQDVIFDSLLGDMKPVAFCDYLKRYICEKAEMTDSFDQISLKEYQLTIQDSFEQRGTPKSFTPKKTKFSALTKNWLTQQTVKRDVIFLLGFGLGMSVDDVNKFLTDVLREHEINFKNPFEVICWYCYRDNLGYAKYEELWEQFLQNESTSINDQLLYGESTIALKYSSHRIHDDESLMKYLNQIRMNIHAPAFSISSRKYFDQLYLEARKCVLEEYNRTALYDNTEKVVTLDEITEADIEHIIYSSIPVDKNGNLSPIKASKLNSLFEGKRFSRQHVHDILIGKSDVNRFDLITLNFFIFTHKLDAYPDISKRIEEFCRSTNEILLNCCLGKLYEPNPYESFVMMCIQTEDPLVTYADVWQLSYGAEENWDY